MKRKLIICDDEVEILNNLSSKIEELQPEKWDIQTVKTREQLEECFISETPDLLMLDIQLKGDNGIEAACEIQKRYPYLPIIFITGYIEYAQEIFRIRPVYMLIKPFDDEKIKDALIRAEEFIDKCKSNYIQFSSKGNIYNIDCKEICYAESEKRKMIINTAKENYEIYMKMDDILKMLPNNFVCTHKSYIVNMNYIQKITKNEVVLYTGKEIPVSRTRYKDVKETFMSFVLR